MPNLRAAPRFRAFTASRRLTASSCSFRLRENDAAKADFMPVFDEQINDITHPPHQPPERALDCLDRVKGGLTSFSGPLGAGQRIPRLPPAPWPCPPPI
jgi:hypothetical protein